MAESIARREMRFRRLAPVSLEASAPPERERLVYVLHDVHRLTPKEIAHAVGAPPEEVLRLLKKARRHAAWKRA